VYLVKSLGEEGGVGGEAGEVELVEGRVGEQEGTGSRGEVSEQSTAHSSSLAGRVRLEVEVD